MTSQSRKIDEMINEYENLIKECSSKMTTDSQRFYNNGLQAGRIEAYQKVISDLKSLKEM